MERILEKIDDILEQEDYIIEKEVEYSFDEEIYNRMVNFIIDINPNDLNDEQLQEVLNIIEDLEINTEELEESGNPSFSKMSTVGKNSYSKKWYRQNKSRVKRKKREFERSSKGRKKEKERKEKQGHETRKNKYHRRIRSDRNDYEKREHGKESNE